MLELDLWPGKNELEGQPIITHGNTLCSIVSAESVLKTIADYCEKEKQFYPIILTLENHLSDELQDKFAGALKKILKPWLYFKPARPDKLPTLEQLACKILIRGKASNPKLNKLIFFRTQHASEKAIIGDEKFVNQHRLQTSVSVNESSSFFKKKEKVEQVRKFNSQIVNKVFPAGKKIDSSNYNPVQKWEMGFQVVALNYQSSDQKTLVNNDFFNYHGNIGYVLKPKYVAEQIKIKLQLKYRAYFKIVILIFNWLHMKLLGCFVISQ